MPPIPGTDPGPFLSTLDWLEGLGQIPLNVARGNFAGAGRKLVDTATSIPDAFLPGNWIPEVSHPEDEVTASEVVGVDRHAHPGIAKAVDIIGGTAANPASWVGLRGGKIRAGVPFREGVELTGATKAMNRAKGLLSTAYEQLPESVQRTASTTAQGFRRAVNWLNVPDEQEAMLRQAKAAGNFDARTRVTQVEAIYKDLSPAEREAVGELAHEVSRNGSTDRATWSVIKDQDRYIADLPVASRQKVADALAARQALMDTIAKESAPAGIARLSPAEEGKSYISRKFSGEYFDEGSPLTFQQKNLPDAIKERAKQIETPEGMLDFLQNKKVDLEFDALVADTGRAQQQARLVEKGRIGQHLAKDAGIVGDFMLKDPTHRAAVTKLIGDIEKQPGMADYAYKLKNAFDGITPRSDNFLAKGLHIGNKLFKGAATYGLVLPRVAFNVRNRTSGVWQALSDPNARQTLGGNAKRVLSDLYGAFDDGLMKITGSKNRSRGKSDLTEQLDYIEDAFRQGGGSVEKVREYLGKHKNGELLTEALDNGVLNNFVDSEELLSRMQRTPMRQRVADIAEWPAEVAQGLEQRMRLGTFLDLRQGKIANTGAEAAKTIRDTYLDYDVAGAGNRAFRDIVPFGSFLSQNVKQQGKFLAEQPSVAVAASQVFGDDADLPKYPWLDQQLTLPVGLDEKEQPQYLSGFGLPIEGLTAIPGLPGFGGGDDFFRDTVGSLQPILKTGIAAAADKDPLTGRSFGEYDKVFGESAGAAGRAYNILKGTGIPQAVTGPIGQIENLLDDRKSAVERGLQSSTGLRFTSVDPDLAERQRIEAYLKTRPDVQTSESLYQRSPDPETQAMLKSLREAKERLREKRKAAAAL